MTAAAGTIGRGPGGPGAPRRADFLPHEIALACLLAIAIHVGAAFALRAAALTSRAAMPEIDRGTATPVRVVPVLDLDAPMLKLGGKRDRMKLPDRWLRQQPKQRVEQKAFPTPKAEKTEAAIPAPDVKVADAGTEPPPPDAEVAKQVDTELPQPIDAGPPSNVDVEGHADGVKEGTETDPLKARAVDVYRSRIAGWFQAGFHCPDTGLPDDELKKLRVGATVQIGGGRTVTGYSMASSGNAAVDAAARARLDGAKGNQIPPPPENYPDVEVHTIQVTLVCK